MIISTTLTGSNQDQIGDAIESVLAYVDRCMVIDTGAKDDTLAVAERVAGDRLIVREFRWRNDFGAARNFALEAAAAAGGRWALTLDTDERLHVQSGVDLAARLAGLDPAVQVVLVAASDGSYAKERIIRLPARVRWDGPTHEALLGQRTGETMTLGGVRFSELPKDEAALQRKFERDIAALRAHTRKHPKEPRWYYYLGASHHDLGQYAAAIEAFRACAALGGWAEEGAWACFRAAQCLCSLGRWKEAIETCARGLAIRPATAELAWLAGKSALEAKRYEDAIAWSNMAIVNGFHDGAGESFARIGFRDALALHEGPYEVLQRTFAALGNHEAAEMARQESETARQARVRGRKPDAG